MTHKPNYLEKGDLDMNTTETIFFADLKEKLANAYAAIRSQAPWHHPKTPTILHHRVLPHATYSPWLMDSDFQAVYQQIKNHTLVDVYRCYELWTLGQQMKLVPGDFLEVGVWRGGTGALLASCVKPFPEKQVFLADTFAGVVKAGEDDTFYTGGVSRIAFLRQVDN